jgi:hypothetical protein
MTTVTLCNNRQHHYLHFDIIWQIRANVDEDMAQQVLALKPALRNQWSDPKTLAHSDILSAQVRKR